MRLAGRVIAITGGAGNIGAATARRLAREGGIVALLDRDPEAAERIRSQLTSDAGSAASGHLALGCDVTDPAAVRAALQQVHDRCGPIHMLFANAGIEGPLVPIADYGDTEFRQVIAIGVEGVFYTLKYGAPLMADGGSIVITSSLFGERGSPTNIGYTAAKHAVRGMMKSAAKAYAPRGIRVNAILPGIVDSDMVRRILAARGGTMTLEEMTANVPLREPVTPDRIADTVFYLTSDDSLVVTGQSIAIDAGWLL